MSIGVVGKKIGMTQIFDQQGNQIPVTVVKVEPNYVVQLKTKEKDGYTAVQLGTVPAKRVTKSIAGHVKKAALPQFKVFREIRTDSLDGLDCGDCILLDSFTIGDYVNVTARSIGKGFQGVVKRHHFKGGPRSHGSMFHRAPGGIGSKAGGKACRKKCIKGKRLPGHMGDEIISTNNLQIVDINLEHNLLVLKGSVPGGGNNIVLIVNSFKKTPQKTWKVEKKKTVPETQLSASEQQATPAAPVTQS